MGLKRFSKENPSPKTYFVKAKKSLGQNFLKSQAALHMMCTAGEVKKGDTVLEIGPGKGALTRKLLDAGAHVIAIEKDRDLLPILEETFKQDIEKGGLTLISGDILEFDPKLHGCIEHAYKIIANIPYNITGAIIKKFLSEVIQPQTMVLLVQKEVAERIVARDGKESILSLSVKVYGNPRYMMKVAKRFFNPAPKVDSAIIAITEISKKKVSGKVHEELFFQYIKAGFAHKRKVLRKNLLDAGLTQTHIDTVFTQCGLTPDIRAEDLSYDMWMKLALELTSI